MSHHVRFAHFTCLWPSPRTAGSSRGRFSACLWSGVGDMGAISGYSRLGGPYAILGADAGLIYYRWPCWPWRTQR